MLIGIPALLGPDLLYTLRAMGHGDEIAIVDGNYPSLAHAKRLVRVDGANLCDTLRAILTVMPLDHVVQPAFRSSENNDPTQRAKVHDEIEAVFAEMTPDIQVEAIDGDHLYSRVKEAHTVVATMEPALYANVILRKGIIWP